MERGNLRCDANMSLRPRAADGRSSAPAPKPRTSTRLRSVERAIRYEIQRQAAILAAGGTITQETRHWHEDTGTTSPAGRRAMRMTTGTSPSPTCCPSAVGRAHRGAARGPPEKPAVRRRRLKEAWGFTDLEFRDVVNSGLLVELEETVAAGAPPAKARKWWTGEIARTANAQGVDAPPSSRRSTSRS